MKVLSLFSGGGLGDYGLELAGMEIVGQVEIDDYCQKILNLRWPDVPKWKDIKNVKGEEVLKTCGTIDLISGGFPCQPFSVAGKKKGKDDSRNMWPEMFRLIREIKPTWVFAENVRGIVKPYLDTVLADLETLGYSCLPLIIPASAIGAPHKRERLWIVAYSETLGNAESIGLQRSGAKRKQESNSRIEKTLFDGSSKVVADANSGREPMRRNRKFSEASQIKKIRGNHGIRKTANEPGEWWAIEPAVGRVAHGVANRVDRLKLLGNGQVVQVVEWIGKQIMEFYE